MPQSLFTTEDISDSLVSGFGYTEDGAKQVAEKLQACAPVIQQSFWDWWQNGVFPNGISAAGYSVEQLMREHGMKPIAALLTLDWLLREPEQARVSLKRGHDEVMRTF